MRSKAPAFLLILLLGLASCASSSPEKCPDEVAAAFDIGSGSTKMMVAQRNSCTGELAKVLAEESIRVAYAQDLNESVDGHFSEAIMAQGTQAIDELVLLAQSYGSTKKVGVATQAFRQATNAQELLNRWEEMFDLQAEIISQRKEGALAYQLVHHQLSPPEGRELLVWDMGGGSQQLIWRELSTGEFVFFNSPIASVTFKNRVLKYLARPKEQLSPNPISESEAGAALSMAREWISSQAPTFLLEFIAEQRPYIVGLGGVHGASLRRQLNLESDDEIRLSQLRSALKEQLNKSDEQIGGDFADTDVTNLILVKALMQVYGINSYRFMSADLTRAVLLSL